MTFDLTNLQSGNVTFYDFAVLSSDATNGLFWGLVILGLFMIQTVLLSTRAQVQIDSAAVFSSWACFIYSIPLSMAGLLNFYFTLGFLALSGFGTFWLYLKDK